MGLLQHVERWRKRVFLERLRRSGVTLEEGAYVAPGSRITRGARIGRYSRINGIAIVRGKGEFRVGSYCAIGVGLHVLTSNHDMRRPGIQHTMHRRFGFAEFRETPASTEV